VTVPELTNKELPSSFITVNPGMIGNISSYWGRGNEHKPLNLRNYATSFLEFTFSNSDKA
jgi:hypothetical protein